MAIASISAGKRGETDRVLAAIVARLSNEGVRILGALRAIGNDAAGDIADQHCESSLLILPDGPVVRISQDLGSGSTACRMDAGALEDAVGIASVRLARHTPDLLVLNKFGLSEAEGRGFRAMIAEALGRGVPVLIGASETHRAAFERFAADMSVALPPDEDAILAWCRNAIDASSVTAGEA